ncbi:MAG: hypothetical protein AB7T63_07515 [Planctomycetota bacterium]
MRSLALATIVVACTACAGTGSGAAPASTARAATTAVHPRLRGTLERVAALRAAGPAALDQTAPLIDEGIALLEARMPHDVARPDVMRWQASREAYGAALKDVIYARDARDADALDRALVRLDGAARRWSDAHLGLPPESSL